MGESCSIDNCESYSKNSDGDCKCLQCLTGYGIGGECNKNGCSSCVKCGQNCYSCKKCVCTQCYDGYTNNIKDPNNCILGDDDYQDYSFKKYECDGSFLKINIFLLIFILLFLKRHH